YGPADAPTWLQGGVPPVRARPGETPGPQRSRRSGRISPALGRPAPSDGSPAPGLAGLVRRAARIGGVGERQRGGSSLNAIPADPRPRNSEFAPIDSRYAGRFNTSQPPCGGSRGTSGPGTTTGSRSAPGRPTASTGRAAERRLADRPRHLP